MSEHLAGVEVFVAAAEAGSFSAAARRQHTTRSAVAKTVARLEARLGARLFHRTTRSQRLTVDGQAYYERCVRALAELSAAEAELEQGRRDVVGRLRVVAPALLGRRCVAPVLAGLAARHPGLDVEAVFADRAVDFAADGVDLAVRCDLSADRPGLAGRTVAVQRMAVCAGPDYLRARGRPQTVDDLAAHTAVVFAGFGTIQPWDLSVGDGIRSVHPPSRLRLGDVEAIADAATAGHGLAWLPRWLIGERLRTGDLVEVLTDVRAATSRVYVLWPADGGARLRPLRVRLAVEALAAELPARVDPDATATQPWTVPPTAVPRTAVPLEVVPEEEVSPQATAPQSDRSAVPFGGGFW